MSFFLFTQKRRLANRRSRIDSGYNLAISNAHRIKDFEKVTSLKSERNFELGLLQEEEDELLTKELLIHARHLRVPVPHKYTAVGEESDHWYQGNQTGGWYLTNMGIAALRTEIRAEEKARHESRAHYVVWLSAITGVIGSVTGLVAVFNQ
jgi:hypothetical protein